MYRGQTVWIMYLAGRLNAGVMTDSPGAIGLSDLANNSSSGPAALCTIPETPLPAKRLGWAEKTMMSAPLCKMSLIWISITKTCLVVGVAIRMAWLVDMTPYELISNATSPTQFRAFPET